MFAADQRDPLGYALARRSARHKPLICREEISRTFALFRRKALNLVSSASLPKRERSCVSSALRARRLILCSALRAERFSSRFTQGRIRTPRNV